MIHPNWFITGASSGLGAALAKAAIAGGARVAVTARDPDRLAALENAHPGKVLPLRLDLADTAAIAAAAEEARAWFGRIDVLVNNAAIGYLAAIEEGEDAKVRALFEANVFGTSALIRAVLPAMREQGHGTIINISSNSGVMAVPSLGYYAASKFALEGLTEALWQEVEPLGIKAMLVEPGGMRTGIVSRNMRSERIDAYAPTAHAIIDLLDSGDEALAPSDPARVAEIILRLATSGRMPRRLILGRDSWAGIIGRLEGQLAEYREWEELSHHSHFETEPA